MRLERYHSFVVLNLSPLSEEQQRTAIAFQLQSSEAFNQLATLSKVRSPPDFLSAPLRSLRSLRSQLISAGLA